MLYDTNWDKKIGNKLLHAAADRLEMYGHVKGKIGRPETGYCMFGAVITAANTENLPDLSAAIEALEAKMFKVAGHHSISAWNDAPERTKEEVIAMLREVAMETAE